MSVHQLRWRTAAPDLEAFNQLRWDLFVQRKILQTVPCRPLLLRDRIQFVMLQLLIIIRTHPHLSQSRQAKISLNLHIGFGIAFFHKAHLHTSILNIDFHGCTNVPIQTGVIFQLGRHLGLNWRKEGAIRFNVINDAYLAHSRARPESPAIESRQYNRPSIHQAWI